VHEQRQKASESNTELRTLSPKIKKQKLFYHNAIWQKQPLWPQFKWIPI